MQLSLAFDGRIHLVLFHRLGEFVADGVELIDQHLGLAQSFFDIATHIFGRVQLRLLGQIADIDAGLGPGFALKLLLNAGHDPQQGGFARTVQAKHADLGAREKGQ